MRDRRNGRDVVVATVTDSKQHSVADDYLANIVEGRCADPESILRMIVMARVEVRRLEEQYQTARDLLARVQPELVPNHDTANDLRAKFGLGGSPDIVTDIRTFLDSNPARESS